MRFSRKPDVVIGGANKPYLLRWYIIIRDSFRLFLHLFLRDDDDRALHDHPANSISFPLGNHFEIIRNKNGTERLVFRPAFIPIFRFATHAQGLF